MGLSRRSPLAATALLALAIATIVPGARGFAVEVGFNETECFSKQIENARDLDDSHALPFRVMGAYVVSKDPHKYYEMQRGDGGGGGDAAGRDDHPPRQRWQIQERV